MEFLENLRIVRTFNDFSMIMSRKTANSQISDVIQHICYMFSVSFVYIFQDYHCHLTTSEVVGYLAGQFDPQTHRKWIL